MDKNMVIQELVDKWIAIADKDLLTAELLLKSDVVVTETICYHCQQSVEKYLKAYLVKHQYAIAVEVKKFVLSMLSSNK